MWYIVYSTVCAICYKSSNPNPYTKVIKLKCFYVVKMKLQSKKPYKMPCQYCHNASHRISSCDASVEHWIGPINEMWVSQRYDILVQIEALKGYSQVKLMMVGRSHGLSMMASSSKGVIIAKVIKSHILTQIIPRAGTLTVAERALINHAYDMIIASVFDGFLTTRSTRMIIKDALEDYYLAWVGQKRMSMSMVELMYAVEHPGHYMDEILLPIYHPGDITVNAEMSGVAECGVCYETKTRVKFNCLHEFCKDCVHLMCAHNNGDLIKCPMCRASVTTLEVEDEASRDALLVVA